MWIRMWLALGLMAGGASAADRSFELPCKVRTLAASAGGGTVWVACERPGGVYALEISAGKWEQLAHTADLADLYPAPKGERAVVVVPEERSNGRPMLYEGSREIGRLPFDPTLVVWSADAQSIYFHAGSTIQADAWNVLGALRTDNHSTATKKLLAPTESLHVCSSTGHIFTGDALPDDHGGLRADTVEYDAAMNLVGRVKRFPAGRFSATCRYVATEWSFHGPLPWEIVETATGRRVLWSDYTGEGKKEEYVFLAWHPTRENLFLRVRYGAGDVPPVIEAFDLKTGRVIESFPTDIDAASWTAGGSQLVYVKGRKLILHPLVIP